MGVESEEDRLLVIRPDAIMYQNGGPERILRRGVSLPVLAELAKYPQTALPYQELYGVMIVAGTTTGIMSPSSRVGQTIRELNTFLGTKPKLIHSMGGPLNRSCMLNLPPEQIIFLDEPLKPPQKITDQKRALFNDFETDWKWLCGFVYNHTRNPNIVEDLADQIVIKALTGQYQLYEGKSFRDWLTRIGYNVLSDYFRMQRMNTADEYLEEFSSRLLSSEDEPSVVVVRNWEVGQLGNALASLPDDHRDVLNLRFIEGYSHQQIAQIMGKSPEAVRQLHVRGLRMLRTYFGTEPNDKK